MKKLFVLAATIWLCSSCAKGTNTGNPFTGPASGLSSSATELIGAVCVRVSSCFAGGSQVDCLQKLPNIAGYPSELGAPASTYSTMTYLAQAEAGQLIATDRDAAAACAAAIKSVDCSSSLMNESFSPSQPADFTQTNRLFRASSECQAIYH